MTTKQMMCALGQEMMCRFEDLKIRVKIEDIKISYGRARFLVKPLAGEGKQWVEIERLSKPAPETLGQLWPRPIAR